MKIITLKQPWATLVAEGIKKYEFRTWKTNYRGKILIHAGAEIDKEGMKMVKCLDLTYPSKRIIASVDIVDCLELNDTLNKEIVGKNNIAYGNKYRTGYAWKLENVKKVSIAREISGKLGMWNFELSNED